MKHSLIEKDPRAEEAMRRWTELKQDRTQFEGDWEDIARLIRPQRGGFRTDSSVQRTLQKPLSSAPIVAQSNFASGLYGALTNPANKWMGLQTSDPELNDFQPMKEWLDDATRRVLASFRPAVSPFYSAAIQLYSDIAAFGNAAQYDELVTAERKIMDVTLSLSEVVWDIDAFGRVTEVVRRFRLNARAAMQMFGRDALPGKVQDMAQKGSTDKLVFYQHVHRNYDYQAGKFGPKGKRWLSTYVSEEGCAVIRESGYAEMPFSVPRWEVDSGFSVGTGPGFTALAAARVHHQMDAATIRAAQFAADPTLLAPDREAWPLNGFVRPGQVIYGSVTMRGDPLVRPLNNTGNIGLTMEEKSAKVEEIKDAFHYSLMSLAGRTGMTATEVMEITEERQRLMAPHMGRIQEEYLAPKIERRFALLWRAGQIPPPPEGAEGTAIEVTYLSAAAAAQRSAEGAAIVRIISDIAPLAQMNPRYIERLDPDATIEALHAARGGPATMLRPREEADKIAEARAQAEQQAQMMQMVQAGGGVAKDLGSAVQAMAPGMGGAR
ncbi:portal protein [Oceaniglobus trochenteri]|uniref:portal protein n=1 Tax=Oceaniglobus trochenteri TaxID=2763260 RepID=UPI001CFF8775|nr:portal protein [Oceaniglobus trochenteri]